MNTQWILPKSLTSASAQATAESTSASDESLATVCAQSLIVRSKPTRSKTFLRAWKKGTWMRLRSGLISGLSLGKSSPSREFFPEDFPVSHFQLLASEEPTPILDTSSPSSSTESADANLPLFSWKTSKESSPQNSGKDGEIQQELPFCAMSSESWKEWVTKQRLEFSQRLKSGLRTKGKECLSWATANTLDHPGCRTPEGVLHQATGSRKDRTRPANLREQVDPKTCEIYSQASWPTITTNEAKNSGPAQEDRKTLPLGTLAGLLDQGNPSSTGSRQGSSEASWPTPAVMDTTGGGYKTEFDGLSFRSVHNHTKDSAAKYGAKLSDAVETHEKNWSTPRTGATDSTRPNNKGGIPLGDQVKREGDFVARNADRGEHCHASLSDQAKEPAKKLNPDWVCTLMGVPIGWVKATPEGSRVDELRLLGNGCVPQTVERAFRVLIERL